MGEAKRSKWNSLIVSTIIGPDAAFRLLAGRVRLCRVDKFVQLKAAYRVAVTFALFADCGFDALPATEIACQREHSIRLAARFISVKVVTASAATIAIFLVPALYQSNTTTSNEEIFKDGVPN